MDYYNSIEKRVFLNYYIHGVHDYGESHKFKLVDNNLKLYAS